MFKCIRTGGSTFLAAAFVLLACIVADAGIKAAADITLEQVKELYDASLYKNKATLQSSGKSYTSTP